ncbi:Uma2 family endonuclease [Oscillatoria sp. CS-180]|uniref:Uma2 family endonuclease n=1 Tax=Oscillatoria sp. CS-180 TaxID=3021720 RepID=UPI00232A8481|nr:Uma2 family endonuclease [Oscillatoria sp. CS-180]MDB9526760.1 Uma2 family endonuclease [Oscillatoria sp. CS-180]
MNQSPLANWRVPYDKGILSSATTAMVTLQLRQLEVPIGQRLLLHDVDWAEFESVLDELGPHRGTRIAYDNGILEIMAPSPEHEYFKETIEDAVKDIAESLERSYESYGSTTWRRHAVQAGIEPDNCGLDIRALPALIEQHRHQGRLALRRALRAWASQ